jgi:hypothetical protein
LTLGYRVNPRFDGRLLVDGRHWSPPLRPKGIHSAPGQESFDVTRINQD